ncbi:MAG: sugar ABC transporter permease [Oscillospiraceae bacterium]|nr:sugar ABC transporter permease [Oscillospiraceae bacterium]
MDQQTMGTVTKVTKQWWLKINTKSFRKGPLDGAVFPHIIRVEYTVDGQVYTKRKWIGARDYVPQVGSTVQVFYQSGKPKKAMIL